MTERLWWSWFRLNSSYLGQSSMLRSPMVGHICVKVCYLERSRQYDASFGERGGFFFQPMLSLTQTREVQQKKRKSVYKETFFTRIKPWRWTLMLIGTSRHRDHKASSSAGGVGKLTIDDPKYAPVFLTSTVVSQLLQRQLQFLQYTAHSFHKHSVHSSDQSARQDDNLPYRAFQVQVARAVGRGPGRKFALPTRCLKPRSPWRDQPGLHQGLSDRSDPRQACDRMLALKTNCKHPETSEEYVKTSIGGINNSPENATVRLDFYPTRDM